MAQLKFSDLLGEVTLDNWKKVIVSTATSVALKTQNWAPGGFTRTLVALFAQLYKTSGDVVRLIAASGFLDTATGLWLKLLAKQVFGVDPIDATFAAAPLALRLTNPGGGIFIFEENDIVVAHASTRKTYRNKSGGTLNAGGTLDLDLEAEEAGSNSNALVGAITTMVTTFGGVTCTNTVALFGLDEEDPDALRQRCRDAIAALSIGGIKRAYEFFAKSATLSDGTVIGVTRVRVMPAPGDGTVTIYVAKDSGSLSSPEVAAIQAIFDAKVTPYGFTATAVSAANLSVTAPLTIWIPSSLGISSSDAKTAIDAALAAFVKTLPIGGVVISPATGRVYWRALLAVAANAIEGTLKAQLTSESDVTVADNEAPVWGGTTADITVNLV